MKKKNQSQYGKSLIDKPWFAISIFTIMTVVMFTLWLVIPQFTAQNLTTIEQKGSYGDSFGSVNALFTGLAFGGVIFTILLQVREIRLQREDFQTQLQQITETKDEVATQSRLLRNQIEVQLLDVLSKSIELDANLAMQQARNKTLGTQFREEKRNEVSKAAAEIRERVSKLSEYIVQN